MAGAKKVAHQPRYTGRLRLGFHPDLFPLTADLFQDLLTLGIVATQQSELKRLAFFIPNLISVGIHPSLFFQDLFGLFRIVGVGLDLWIVGPRIGQDGTMGDNTLSV